MLLTLSIVAWSADSRLPDAECNCFVGETRGNDTARALFRLCRDGTALTGHFDWTSQRSGRSIRRLEGVISGDAITLHDLEIVADLPSPGWRFCAIDLYELRLAPNGALSGTYDSSSCRDRAEVNLAAADCPRMDTGRPGAEPAADSPTDQVPDEVQACRVGGLLKLSDPEFYERTEIRNKAGWAPVWQIRDYEGSRPMHLLVYPGSCRVVRSASGAEPVVARDGAPATAAEIEMLRRWNAAAR